MKQPPFKILHFAFSISFILALQGVAGAPFTSNGDGTVTDQKSKLIWQRCSMGYNSDAVCSDDGTAANNTANWADALAYCNTLSLAGRSWRLPSINELKSIVDETRSNPTIDTVAFPATAPESYWSSTTYAVATNTAWVVWFEYVYAGNLNKALYKLHVRCVSAP